MRRILLAAIVASPLLAQQIDWVSQIRNKPSSDIRTYNFTQQPGGSVAIGSNTITMKPCAVSGSAVAHYVYLSGGTSTPGPEAVLVTGGSCGIGKSTGTITFTAAGTHTGAWTVQSATSGLAECHDTVGIYGACAIPPGNWPMYGPYTNSNCSSLNGYGSFQSVLNVQFATGSAMTFLNPGSLTCNYIDTGGYAAAYLGLESGFYMSSGSNMINFINVTDGQVQDVTVQGASVAFQITGVPRVQFHNLRGLWKGGACINISGVGPLTLDSAPQFEQIYCAAGDNTGQQFAISNAAAAGPELNNFFFEGGAAFCLYFSSTDPTRPINEMIISNGDCDGPVSGIIFNTSGSISDMVQFSNVRVHATTGPALSLSGQNIMMDNMHLETNATSGPGALISAATNIYLRNSDIITGAGAEGLQLQSTVTNSVFDGITSGDNYGNRNSMYGLVTDSSAIAGNYFAGTNRFFGTSAAVNWAATGAGNFFAPGQIGLSVPSVASAATLPFPPFPNFTVTGTAVVTAVSGLISGQAGSFVPTTASPGTWTAGGTIGNSCTMSQNKSYTYWFDGTKVWLSGPGC